MKRSLFVFLMIGCVLGVFAQEKKPVIGLDTVKVVVENADAKEAAQNGQA